MSRLHDLTGQRFGALTALERAETRITPNGSRFTYWTCRCDCGRTVEVRSTHLTHGKIRTCGSGVHFTGQNNSCFRHGHKDDRLYSVWNGMKQRCSNPSNPKYKQYGERGITVCETWKNDYGAFRAWAYSNGYDENAKYGDCTLDRIDVNGDYCPNNCRWANAKEQADNRRRSVFLTFNGETRVRKDWAREFHTDCNTLQNYLNRGHTMREARDHFLMVAQ